MRPREELELILSLIKKYNLPLSPILEYAIKDKEDQYNTEKETIKTVRDNESICNTYKELTDYIQEFENMSVGISKGKKLPHKAILLLGLMDLIEAGIITENRIELDNVIANAFANSWHKYFETKVPTVWTPFYHLKKESFWNFKANGNAEKLSDILNFGGTPSIGKMRPIIKYAYLDKALFDYIKDDRCREKFREVLIKNYIE